MDLFEEEAKCNFDFYIDNKMEIKHFQFSKTDQHSDEPISVFKEFLT